jgi:hypothetical protein
MKMTIRQGVFETNSSSTHSFTICHKEDYDRWVKGEIRRFANSNDNNTTLRYYNSRTREVETVENIPPFATEAEYRKILDDAGVMLDTPEEIAAGKAEEAEAIAEAREEYGDDIEGCYDPYISNFDAFFELYENYQGNTSDNYEDFSETFKTKSGDEVIVFGYYGSNN